MTRIDRPSEPPTCCIALSTPEAAPRSAGSETPSSATPAAGGIFWPRPAIGLEVTPTVTMMVRLTGRKARPAWTGLWCSTFCVKTVRKKNRPAGAPVRASATTWMAARSRLVNIRSGVIGLTVLCSTSTKAAGSTRPPMKEPIAQLSLRPCWETRMKP
ncbi:hypothetical protein ACFWOT_13170 [Streptomyces sp. NPDC058440]|uniref:hypothetical protein n=1 Tax=Streptomyces sp. NPDC058440 TaxID=3346501 RepID=UPI00365F4EA8